MSQACRAAMADIITRAPQGGSHPGLLLDRYLIKQDDKQARKDLFDWTRRALQPVQELYERAYRRYLQALEGCMTKEMVVTGRMVLGLGAASVLETGLTLHHTYGTPYIPGSSLKGLAASYCDAVWGRHDEGFRKGGPYYQTFFGTTDDSGYLLFYDAWIKPSDLRQSLVEDVMSVHHPEYYRGSGAPTDFDDPIPLSFLGIRGTFTIPISCDVLDEEGAKWLQAGMDLLTEALENWGIGGKTSSGYGRMREGKREEMRNER